MQLCPNCNYNNRDGARYCANCPTELKGLLGANVLLQGRYEILRVLGCGGMGAVYLAEATHLGRKKVAVKENFDTSTGAQSQFQKEAAILAHLNHPHLPTVSDHFIEANGRQYLVMTYIEGRSLADLLTQAGGQPLAEPLTLVWADQLLDALIYCHAQGVLHRDIKPQNIILTPAGQVLLVDFGLVKLYDPANPATNTIIRGMGTASYAPPEQYLSGHTESRSDLYALGATLYHLLTGQPPVSAGQHTANPASLQPPRQLNPALTPATEAAIQQAMALPLDQRFQNAAEMRRALRPTSQPLPQALPHARPAWLWPGVAATLVILAGLNLLIGLLLLRNSSQNPTIDIQTTVAAAVAATRQAEITPSPTTTEITPTREVTATPTIAPASPPQAGDVVLDAYNVPMVYIPAGPFAMGNNNGPNDEKPVHTVTLEAFYIDQYEVTNTRYAECVSAGNCTPPAETKSFTRDHYYGNPEFADYPVIYVNWNQAKSYCAWRGGRLPTEAEWEKAARGTDGRTYPWGEEIDCQHANYQSKCLGDTAPVGNYPTGASLYGVYDLAGNVWEWTQSEYRLYPYNARDGRENLNSTDDRVLRGGSWFNVALITRSSYHLSYSPTRVSNSIGFRCAR